MSHIEDEMHYSREKMKADGEFYSKERLAEANRLLLTPEYLELKRYEAIASNNKVYFGKDIPSMFINHCSRQSEVDATTLDTITASLAGKGAKGTEQATNTKSMKKLVSDQVLKRGP
ncbi:erlin-2-like isoform X2 [Rhipicephalus sanguineus]|nr:erlin-2-like isoform X2 [Rhipicephalus sanguineus]